MKSDRLIILSFTLTLPFIFFTTASGPNAHPYLGLESLYGSPAGEDERVQSAPSFLENTDLEEGADNLRLRIITFSGIDVTTSRGFSPSDQVEFLKRIKSYQNPPRSPPVMILWGSKNPRASLFR